MSGGNARGKKLLEQSCLSLTDLVDSDIESDCKNSLCEEPQFESAEDDIEVKKRGMWADHLVRWLDSEFKSEVEAPCKAPEEAPVVDPFPDQGCSDNGKSQRHCGCYLCSMDKKQIPPRVHQELLKWIASK